MSEVSRAGILLMVCCSATLTCFAQAQQPAGTVTETFESTPLANWELLDGAQVVRLGEGGNVLQFQQPGLAAWHVGVGQSFTLQFGLVVQRDAAMSVIFRGSGEPPNVNEYALAYESGQFHLLKRTNGQESPLANGPGIQPNTWATIILQVNGGQITVSADGQQVLSATDPQPLTQGGIAFQGSATMIDSISLTGASARGPMPEGQAPPGEGQPQVLTQQPVATIGQQAGQQGGQQPVQQVVPQPVPVPGQQGAMQQLPGGGAQIGTVMPQMQAPVLPGVAGASQVMPAGASAGPYRTFLRIDMVTGPSTRMSAMTGNMQAGWMEVYDWALEIESQDVHAAAVTSAGPLVIYKPFDDASVDLIRHVGMGTICQDAQLEVVLATGGAGQMPVVMELRLQAVRILSMKRLAISPWGAGVEELQLGYDRLEWRQQGISSPAGGGAMPRSFTFQRAIGGAIQPVVGPPN